MSWVIELRQAMPYLRLFQDKIFVIKLGGALLDQTEALDRLAHQVALLHQLHIRVVLVHGGGPQANRLARRLGLETRTVNGRRVTDPETLQVCKMVFNGCLNTDLLAALNAHQVPVVGLSGVDAKMIESRRREPATVRDSETGKAREIDFGCVGDIVEVRPELPHLLLESNFVPVVSSLTAGQGSEVLNVNADTVAARLAVGLGAEKLILLTSAPGVLEDRDDPNSLISHMHMGRLQQILESSAQGGMHAKLEACLDALRGGIPQTHIISALETDSLLVEVFTNQGCGTLIEK